MLTRVQISGFKNLNDVDLRFGPFTCIAGPNAAGKSNLFDALTFLSRLTQSTLLEAALSVRSGTSDIRSIFYRVGDEISKTISISAEMILPQTGFDDLGQEATATTSFVRYELEIEYIEGSQAPNLGNLRINSEKLDRLKITDAPKHLRFPHTPNSWRKSVLSGRRTTPFISTIEKDEEIQIRIHQDGSQGKPRSFLAKNLPRTVISTANAAESPTAQLAKEEMHSWRLLQLEPASMRAPDSFMTTPRINDDGAHLPATLYSLAHSESEISDGTEGEGVMYQVASRLRDLLNDVRLVNIDRDEKRELLTLTLKNAEGTILPANALSDGTLRFLALSIMENDPRSLGLICFEEPENGMHPERIPDMIQLLQDIACDVDEPIGDDNPLRQVIINTHSPLVVANVPYDSLLLATLENRILMGKRTPSIRFSALNDTWRSSYEDDKTHTVGMGTALRYLNAVHRSAKKTTTSRVIDRDEIQMNLFGV